MPPWAPLDTMAGANAPPVVQLLKEPVSNPPFATTFVAADVATSSYRVYVASPA